MDLTSIRNAATQDELIEASNAIFNAMTTDPTPEQVAEIDAAFNARMAELNSASSAAAMPDPPALTLTQRNHHVLIDEPPFEGHRLEHEAKIGRSGWRPVTHLLRGAFGHESVLDVPVRFATVYVRARYEGGEWGPTAKIRQQEKPRRVSRSNPYWHYWRTNDREGWGLTCGGCLPGVNEVDADGNTIGHIIAGARGDGQVDEHGNFVDDRSYNRAQWLGRLLGDGGEFRGAGLDVRIKNKAGQTVADVWAANDAERSVDYDLDVERATYAGAPWA
ncbi:MAG: hypothetical protein OXG79_12475 [Chloroflexi bacterium]|nr:hypothetical protein [Chloroflexota bacterium]